MNENIKENSHIHEVQQQTELCKEDIYWYQQRCPSVDQCLSLKTHTFSQNQMLIESATSI